MDKDGLNKIAQIAEMSRIIADPSSGAEAIEMAEALYAAGYRRFVGIEELEAELDKLPERPKVLSDQEMVEVDNKKGRRATQLERYHAIAQAQLEADIKYIWGENA